MRPRLLVTLLGLSTAMLVGAFTLPLLETRQADALVKPDGKPVSPSPTTSRRSPTTGRLPANAPMVAELRQALDALSDDDATGAIAIRDRLPKGLERNLLSYAISVSGIASVSIAEIDATRQTLKDWPGLAGLRKLEEYALFRQNPDPETAITVLGAEQPQTPEGKIALARAYQATGEATKATTIIRELWAGEVLYPALENVVMANFPAMLTSADQKARMAMLLYAGKLSQARRFAPKAEASALFEAFASVLRKTGDAGAKIKAARAGFANDPALVFAEIRHLRQTQKYEEAARLFEKHPFSAAARIDPGQWWNEQRIIGRALVDKGDAKAAYRLVASHDANEPLDIVEAEFHAGWYALRNLEDSTLASRHFARILVASDRPIALSRGNYWLGRAAEAGGPGIANDFYTKAAFYSGTFYGQLASAKLKRANLTINEPVIPDQIGLQFNAREPVRAIDLLLDVGHGRRAQRIIRAMAAELTDPAELVLLHRRATAIGGPTFALEIGKLAYGRGISVPTLAWPVGAIPDSADTSGSGKALAYAVARQESSFNPAAVSPANAKGLLQLLPTTAQHVAGRHGIAWQQELLTTDPAYNATLGAHYLGEQISDFKGSYILTLIAYNAGPRRVREWIKRYGDPRGKPIDAVVDWVERIPFAETRSYVQRVMENYQVYKARLGDNADIERDLTKGRSG